MLALNLSPLAAQLQRPTDTWNAGDVLELVGRASQLRQSNAIDPDFRNYTAEARGYVYFFFDRPDSADQVLVTSPGVPVMAKLPDDVVKSIVAVVLGMSVKL